MAFVFSIITTISVSTFAQTLALSDGSIIQGKTKRIGLNIGSINYYDNGQILKNLIGSSNPGFEPLMDRQIWALAVAGTTTTFSVPNIYDGVPANYWTGATFSVVAAQSGGAELGCTGTIASNTGPNYPVATALDISPVITVSTACSAPFSIGDIVIITKSTYPTPEAWWETGGRGGTSGGVSGGGQLLSDTTDLCATCGTQALNMNATASGSSTTANWYFDGSYSVDMFVMMNGTYELSFWAKAAAGTPTLSASAMRLSAGGFNCGTYKPTLSSTWTQYTFTCSANESTSSTTPGTAQVQFQTVGGSVYLDNVNFSKTSSTINNPTVFRDEVIETLQKYYGNAVGAPPGVFRYWVNQNGETLDNWTNPDYAHGPTTSGGGYFVGPGGAGAVNLSLEDYLAICQLLGAEPYLEVPVTFSATEAENLIEFLASPSSTTYGSKRAALGQSTPWTDVFDQIHLAFCNECWNGYSFSGQSLSDRSSQPNNEFYYDYSVRAKAIFAAMREDPYYSAPSFDLVMNAQTATNYTMDIAIQRADPDSVEIEDYTYGAVSSFATDAELWQPAMVDPYEKVTNPKDIVNFYQSVHDYQSQKTCGPTGTSSCNVNIYEWGQGTISGTIDQTHLDYINVGAGEGVVMALQPLLNMQYYGILPQSYFSLTEYENGGPNGEISKLWGNIVDMGGATNNVRPSFLGVSLINQSIIGPMYSCPIANNLTYNFAGSPNGVQAMPAMTNVPYLYAFCFENGTKRSLVLINTDLVNSHSLAFSGSNTPTGTVTQRQYAPASLDALNEAPTGTDSYLTPAAVSIQTSTLSSPASLSLPAYSVTALDYTALYAPVVATPAFAPSSGTYTTAQSVTISDATPGTTIYYTTNGTAPTTASTMYSGSITVSAGETIEAIAVETNFTNSAIASAAYTIAPVLPTPTFSIAAGTYTTAQSVTLNDSAGGATIYYTTNGTAPTTASTKYSGAVTIGANETLEAIAVQSGYTNSTTATATYKIAPVLPTPTFSPAGGSYSATQSVTIGDSASGTTIYYTTNGTAPTTSSSIYSGAITVSATETLEAIAVEAGYTNSSVATATYAISGCTSYISITPGAFKSSSLYLNGGSTVTSGGVLQITDGGSGESRTAWFTTQVPVQSFITDFTFQQLNATADGMTFTIQGKGSTAVGGNGGSLGYQGITNSIAIKFDLFGNSTEGIDSTGLYTNGAAPTIPSVDLSSTGINLHSSDIMDAHLVYDGTNLTMTLTDTVTSAAVTEVFPVNIPNIVGANTAYIGFTGGTGGSTATQNVLSWTYVSRAGQSTVAPTFSPTAGSYTSTQSVTISDATAGSAIYYTTNGATPTSSSTLYTGPVAVSASEVIEAIAVGAGNSNSPVATAAYTITPPLPAPTFSLAAGTFTSTQTVSIGDSIAGTSIYYTTNGTTPTTSSTLYTGSLTISATETLSAIAVESGYTNSPTTTATFTIAPVLPAPAFNPPAGTYTTSQSISISDTVAGVTIYYTTNGTTPTTTSAVYSGPVTATTTEMLKAFAVKTGYTNSSVASSSCTINPIISTPTFSPAAGTYATPQTVTISDALAGTTIYYTTNGTAPTTSSSVYSGPITVSASETLSAIAIESGYTVSPEGAAAYTINPPYISIVNGGFQASSLYLNGGPTITSTGVLQLTDGGSGESHSVWFTTEVPVQNFVTDFTFQQTNATADGMTFAIQGQGAGSLGGNGAALGYQGIPNSIAVKFDLYSNSGEGVDSTGLYTNGAAPTVPAIDLTSTGINLHSADIMHAHMVYDGTNLTMTLTDTVTNATVTEVFPVNIPSIVGGNTAYVGFTGCTGGKTSTQQVLSWTYSAQ